MEFLESFDQGFWNFLQAKRQPWLDPLLAAAAFPAQPLLLLAVAGIGAATLAYRRRFAEAGAVAASCGGAFLLALALGCLVDRPPPTVVLRPLEEASERSSFPSVETLTATATYLGLALAWRQSALVGPASRAGPDGPGLDDSSSALRISVPRCPGAARLAAPTRILAGAMVLVLVIGLARAFIGTNYPSDILAGWLGGAAWALVCQRLTCPSRKR